MDLKAPLPKEFQKKVDAVKVKMEKKRLDEADKTSGWDDCEIMQPTSAWDKSDREGTCGNGKRYFSVPSKAYKNNYVRVFGHG